MEASQRFLHAPFVEPRLGGELLDRLRVFGYGAHANERFEQVRFGHDDPRAYAARHVGTGSGRNCTFSTDNSPPRTTQMSPPMSASFPDVSMR
jgi:hypothetical protein